MKNNKAFSLVEMLVSILVASILILTIGVLSEVANSQYRKAQNTQSIYNDVSYAFKFIRNKVRSGDSMTVNATSNPPWAGLPKTNPPFILSSAVAPWAGGRLLMTYTQAGASVQGAFCVYQATGALTKALVYIPNTALASNCDATVNCEKILSVPVSESLNLTFARPPESAPTSISTGVPVNSVLIRLEGKKNKILFDFKNVILRRAGL